MNDSQIALQESILKAMRAANKLSPMHANKAQNTDGQWFGGALVVEPRYVENLYHGLDSEGFSRAA
jgi:hypothetical protein